MPFRLLFLFIFSWSSSLAIATDCEEWNTEEFFQTASLEDVKTCLSQGADPRARAVYDNTPYGSTPLHRAAMSTGPAVITLLLDAGADPKARDEFGETPLHQAA